MSSSHEQDQPSTSQSPLEQDAERVYQYYERYLKNMHPNWSDEKRQAFLEQWSSDNFRVSMVEGMMEADEMIRKNVPLYKWRSMADFPQWLEEWYKYLDSLENKHTGSPNQD